MYLNLFCHVSVITLCTCSLLLDIAIRYKNKTVVLILQNVMKCLIGYSHWLIDSQERNNSLAD